VSRRSPTNERYQKFTEPKGQTRKSSASAKPVRKEGGAATASKSKPKAKGSSAPGGKFYEPDTPEYKFWRRMWWISLGTGLFFVALSFFIQYYLKAVGTLRVAGVVTIGLSYAAIIAAFFIDWRKLRPMRTGKYVPKTSKAEKPSKPSTPAETTDSTTDDES